MVGSGFVGVEVGDGTEVELKLVRVWVVGLELNSCNILCSSQAFPEKRL